MKATNYTTASDNKVRDYPSGAPLRIRAELREEIDVARLARLLIAQAKEQAAAKQADVTDEAAA